jgi:Gpi18-like mannosyltransferase
MTSGPSKRGHGRRPKAAPAGSRDALHAARLAAVGVALLLGLGFRLAVWSYATTDAELFLKPWYAFAHEHGWKALGVGFTNYTPFYSYLLIAVTGFHGLAPPLLLVKAISFAFEFATAILAYRFVLTATGSRNRASVALAAAWIAPSVLYDGALWGQSDSIWAFFLVLSAYLFSTGRNGVLPFATAFAVKAQGAFLGPFALGMALRQRRSLLWFAAIPLVYLAFALPTFAAGRPLSEVLRVYAEQANTYHELSMNAANIWILALGRMPYSLGVAAGLIAAAVAGLALAVLIEKSKRTDIEFNTLAACLSLLIMPLLLPKMHDRYFYAFEMLSIVLACLNRRYLLVALAAQTSAFLSYIAFDHLIRKGVPVAAVQNLILAGFLVHAFVRPNPKAQAKRGEIVAYVLASGALACLLPFCRDPHPNALAKSAFLLGSCLLGTHIGLVFYRMSRAPAPADGNLLAAASA